MLYGNFENCPKVKWKKYTDNTDLKNDWNYHVSWYIFIGFASSISFLLSLLVSYARTLFFSSLNGKPPPLDKGFQRNCLHQHLLPLQVVAAEWTPG